MLEMLFLIKTVVNNQLKMNTTLAITDPKNNRVVQWEQKLELKGKLTGTVPITLYYRWYSSFNTNCEHQKYSINSEALPSPEIEVISGKITAMGSHPVIFVASDRPKETDADLQEIGYALIAGGSQGTPPCVIHVLKAKINRPKTGDTVSRASLILQAEAPTLWQNEQYQKYNRLSYLWELNLAGNSSEPISSGKLGKDDLRFGLSEDNLPAVTVSDHLTKELIKKLVAGVYEITLFVVANEKDEIGRVSDKVTVTLY